MPRAEPDSARRCRLCGCTDEEPCFDWDTGEACAWVAEDLCDGCSWGGPAAPRGHGPDDEQVGDVS
ncbi:MAG: hypothetical protein ACK4Z0_05800 [Sphingomonadaceae bacterium]